MTEKQLKEYITLKRACIRAKEYYEDFLASFASPRAQQYDIEPGGGTPYSPDTLSPEIEEKDKRKKQYDDAFSAYTLRHWEIQYAMEHLTEEEKEFVHIRYLLGVYDFDMIGRALHMSRRAVFRIRESVLEKISKI